MNLLEALKVRWVVWVWKHTPDCAEMSRLASASLEQPLPLKTRLKIRLHYFICVWCERYQEHLKFLRQAAPRFPEQLDMASSRVLTAEAKRRMVRRLRAAHEH